MGGQRPVGVVLTIKGGGTMMYPLHLRGVGYSDREGHWEPAGLLLEKL